MARFPRKKKKSVGKKGNRLGMICRRPFKGERKRSSLFLEHLFHFREEEDVGQRFFGDVSVWKNTWRVTTVRKVLKYVKTKGKLYHMI